MDALARELAQADLPATLQVRRMRLASGAVRQRLFWRMRGEARITTFECVRRSFPLIPAPLHGYLEARDIRVQELNAIEAIFRYAASQLEMYLDFGTVRESAAAQDIGVSRFVKNGDRHRHLRHSRLSRC